jgi:hypothetical protein
LLILLGVVLLLRNMDFIGTNYFWTDFLIYFPIILIAIGVEKIFTRTKFQFISYLTSAFLFAGGLYLALSGGTRNGSGDFFQETNFEWTDDTVVKELHATLNLGRSNITVRDATDGLVTAQFKEFSAKPEIQKEVDGTDGKIVFSSKGSRFLGGLVKVETGDQDDWYLSFSNTVPLNLECFGSEGDIHLNLATTPVKSVKIDAENASVYLKLGDIEPRIDVTIAGADSEVRLRVPQTAGLKISGMSDANYLSQLGLKLENGAYVSERYDMVDRHIDVVLDDKQSSLSIDFY